MKRPHRLQEAQRMALQSRDYSLEALMQAWRYLATRDNVQALRTREKIALACDRRLAAVYRRDPC